MYKVCISSLCFLMLVGVASYYTKDLKSSPVNSEVKPKVVYLTFDDGPSKNTQAVLDVLAKYEVQATFFVTGQNPEFADMIKKEADMHHTIGVHTYSHSFKEIYSSIDAYFQDLDKMNHVIKEQTGKTSNVLRFPGGSSNTVSRNYSSGIMSTLAKETEKRGYRYYDWNATNGDGACGTNASSLANTAIREAGNQDSVVMLMHDGTCNAATAESLSQVIEHFKSQGYEFRGIDALTPVAHHTIAN